ncbi:hypothetical protein OQZ33_05520 [Pedobacter sp. MC2016-05]|uniref:hypothetical protein n=1 Tax=Pedobacter sp. MC2016-05 TaxID=2994474 RepID=UPI002246116A|nr:hypothetical protein [Pedobacter sp. MC2016-05]MCX2473782.1 hypothetical protein [Pedobacter sp. MC2016-05]
MGRIFLNVSLLIFLGLNAAAQRSDVVKVLVRYQIDSNVLNNRAKESAKSMAFDLRQTTSLSTSEKIEIASYNGARADGSKWVLKSVNGRHPSDSEVKSFLKAHPEQVPVATIDQDSYKILSADHEKVVVEFSYLENSLTPENMFLRDCKGRIFINTNTKLLEKQEVQNQVPLKVKGIRITKLLTTSVYFLDQKSGVYLTREETTNLIVKLLVMTSDSVITSEYSNYGQP